MAVGLHGRPEWAQCRILGGTDRRPIEMRTCASFRDLRRLVPQGPDGVASCVTRLDEMRSLQPTAMIAIRCNRRVSPRLRASSANRSLQCSFARMGIKALWGLEIRQTRKKVTRDPASPHPPSLRFQGNQPESGGSERPETGCNANQNRRSGTAIPALIEATRKVHHVPVADHRARTAPRRCPCSPPSPPPRSAATRP